MARRTDDDHIQQAIAGNFIDRMYRYVSPVKGLERQRARVASAMVGGYVGASRSARSMQGWRTTTTDQDAAQSPFDRTTLIDRSEDLARNNSVARGAINTLTTTTIGPGLRPTPAVDADFLGISEDQASAYERQAYRIFNYWASNPAECDIARKLTFYQQQQIGFRSANVAGDMLALLQFRERPGTKFGTKLQLIEGVRVGNKGNAGNTDRLVDGIEFDGDGAAQRYHIMQKHPGSRNARGQQRWAEVPAYGANSNRRNVIHLARYIRPDQTRGEPWFAPVMETIKQLGRYHDNELAAAVVAAMFTVFLKPAVPGTSFSPWDVAERTGGNETNASGTSPLEMGNAAIVELGEGDDISTANPGRPNSAYGPFVDAKNGEIGMGLEMPYEILVKHFTASYSASQAAINEFWRSVRVLRGWTGAALCQPVYEAVLSEAVARGELVAPGFLDDPMIRAAYCGVIWTGPPKGQLREDIETKAAILRVEAGFSTIDREGIAINGENFETNHKQRVKEQQLRESDGLTAPLVDPSEPVVADQV